MKVEVGDWVCFQMLGQPVYAVVMYVLESEPCSSLGRKIITSAGEYHESGTLEIRRVRPGEVTGG